MAGRQRTGGIEVVFGPMFSGKTTELLRRLQEAGQAGLKYQAFKPAQDYRYASDQLVTHDGHKLACIPVLTPLQVLKHVNPNTDLVGIDEVHMFKQPGELAQVAKLLAKREKRIILVGVDTDKYRVPFAWLNSLGTGIERTHLSATCARCGRPAYYSQRLDTDQTFSTRRARIEVGGPEKYEPRCARCHRGIAKRLTARD